MRSLAGFLVGFSVALASAASARADSSAPAAASYEPVEAPSPIMRNAGAGLTVTGIVLGLAGGGMLIGSVVKPADCKGEECSGAGSSVLRVLGGISAGWGGAMLAAGIPLWVVGQQRLDDPGPQVAVSAGPTRFVLRVCF